MTTIMITGASRGLGLEYPAIASKGEPVVILLPFIFTPQEAIGIFYQQFFNLITFKVA